MTEPSHTEESRALVETFITECVNGDLDRIEEFVAADFRGHGFPGFGDLTGPAEFRRFFESLRAGFTDFEATIEDVVAEPAAVALRATVRGRHTGEFMGVAPTDREVEVSGIRLFRLADGKISEVWVTLDSLGLFQQLGVVPERFDE